MSFAVAKAHEQDTSLFNLVDPSDAVYDEKQPFIVCKTNRKESFVISSPPMLSMFAEDTREGSLGKVRKYDAPVVVLRTAAHFSLKLAVGGVDMDDLVLEIFPNLVEDQMLYIRKMYQTCVAIMTSIFEQNPAKFSTQRSAALTSAYNAEIAFEGAVSSATKSPPKYTTIAALKECMKSDPALDKKIRDAHLQHFLAAANMTANPAQYDEAGVKLRDESAEPAQDGSEEKVKYAHIKVERAVWKQLGKYDPTKTKPELPTFTALDDSIDNWFEVYPKAIKNYTYNPFRYFDNKTGAEIKRPMILPPGVTDKKKAVPDLSWSALNDKVSLIAGTVSFQVYATAKAYGVRVVPQTNITIIHQSSYKGRGKVVTYAAPSATGYAKKEEEEEEHVPPTKKQRTDDGVDSGMTAEEEAAAME